MDPGNETNGPRSGSKFDLAPKPTDIELQHLVIRPAGQSSPIQVHQLIAKLVS